MQRDSATYVDEPEDADDYAAWRSSSFSMSSMQPEVDKILAGAHMWPLGACALTTSEAVHCWSAWTVHAERQQGLPT